MKITALNVYPIKGIRGIPLTEATLTPQGFPHDRTFMLLKILDSGAMHKMQLASYPECSLFEQAFTPDGSSVTVTYHPPTSLDENSSLATRPPPTPLTVPLQPDALDLEEIDILLHNSPTMARRMGKEYDDWFSACFGFGTVLVYLGDGKRQVLGSFTPKAAAQKRRELQPQQQESSNAGTGSWLLSSVTSYLTGGGGSKPSTDDQNEDAKSEEWLTFSDVSPFLITSEASLAAVSARLPPETPMIMNKFRPNVVVDGVGEESWSEDFWAELLVAERHRLVLTANCVRCSSINVDYDTGRQAEGESGTVLKKLMKDRRVDTGSKWSPVFGRYGFLAREGTSSDLEEEGDLVVRVGDEVEVLRRNEERTVFDWPLASSKITSQPRTVVAASS